MMLRSGVFVVRIVDPNKQTAPPELRFVVCGRFYKQYAPPELRCASERVLL